MKTNLSNTSISKNRNNSLEKKDDIAVENNQDAVGPSNKKWVKVLLLSLLGIGSYMAICVWIISGVNKKQDAFLAVDRCAPIDTDYPVSSTALDETSMIAKEPTYKTGGWVKENYINEYGEYTDEPQFKLHLYVENLITNKDYNLYIIYRPNMYFELNGLEEYWGYDKLKIRDDNTGLEVAINYRTDTRQYTQNYIRIEQKKSITQFFELLEDGNFTMLLNENDVCHVDYQSTGLSESLLKYKIYDSHIPVTSFGSEGEQLAEEAYNYLLKEYARGADPIDVGEVYGRVDFRKNEYFREFIRQVVKSDYDFQTMMNSNVRTTEFMVLASGKIGSFTILGTDYKIDFSQDMGGGVRVTVTVNGYQYEYESSDYLSWTLYPGEEE